LHEKEKNEHKIEKGVYYPSALFSCLRKQYYTFVYGERVSSEELVIFATGKGVHETIARAFGEVAKVEKVEENILLEVTPVSYLEIIPSRINIFQTHIFLILEFNTLSISNLGICITIKSPILKFLKINSLNSLVNLHLGKMFML